MGMIFMNADNFYPRGNIIGVHVSAINMNDALEALQLWISTRQPYYVCVTPAFSVLEGHDDPDLRRIYNSSGLTTPDGIPVTKILRWQGFKNVARVYGPDLMLAACKRSLTTGWRHYFYGGSPTVVVELAKKLQAQFPGLQIAGIESPPFRPLSPAEEEDSVKRIRAAQPDIVWVGLGAPRQDKWMAVEETFIRYRRLLTEQKYFGADGKLYKTLFHRIYEALKREPAGWYDFHAKLANS